VFYNPLPQSGIPPKSVATTAGGIITIDCDYDPVNDNVRTRPPVVTDVHISNVKVGNVATAQGKHSGYQAIVIHGPVAGSYNGPERPPKVVPVRNITIRDCDFGSPVQTDKPFHLYNVEGLTLENVTVSGKTYNQTFALPAADGKT
jgi:polygalacturonase